MYVFISLMKPLFSYQLKAWSIQNKYLSFCFKNKLDFDLTDFTLQSVTFK